MKSSFLIKMIILSLFVGGTYFYARMNRVSIYESTEQESYESAEVVKELPNFKFKDEFSKKDVEVRGLLGKSKIVVHFWGTWCAPCEEELPGLIDTAKKTTETTYLILAITDTWDNVRKFLGKKGLTGFSSNIHFGVDVDSVSLSRFGTLKVPETFIFDNNGKLHKKLVGPQDWSVKNFDKLVSKN